MSAPAEYSKLASNIVFSSLWEKDSDTCKVWVTLLALKDMDGIVDKNITGIHRITGIPLQKCEEAVQYFLSPDPQSTSKIKEGRRLEMLPDGRMLVINHGKYQELGWSAEKRKAEREKKAKYRAGLRAKENSSEESESPSRFSKPTIDDLIANGLHVEDAEKFLNYYDSKGWKVGKVSMKDWKASARNWKKRSTEYNGHSEPQRELTDAEILRQAMQ